MNININKFSDINIYHQLYTSIRTKILKKELVYGMQLPSERKLADQLNINRSTIVTSYNLLKSEGLIQSLPGNGTFVAYSFETSKNNSYTPNYYNWTNCFELKAKNKYNGLIQLIMTANSKHTNYFLAGGLPDDTLIPHKAFQQIGKSLFENNQLNVLSHSSVSGVNYLKYQLKYLMKHSGVNSNISEILVTSGSQQALDLIFRAFIKNGDTVIVEEPTFFGALQLLKQLGATIISIPMDKDGINIEILEFMIKKHKPKFIYTIPTHHNPTGISMSLRRRYKLLELSNLYNIPIIEDDPYSSICFNNSKIPSLKSIDKSNYVIYISTFSKTISLGIRIGWIVANSEVINLLKKVKQLSDLHVNTFNQYLVASFIESSDYDKHLHSISKIYKAKRDLMIDTLNKNFNNIQFTIPNGGFYLWVTFNDEISTQELFEECLQNGLTITPDYHFIATGINNKTQIRLNFTYPNQNDIVNGITLLAKCHKKIKEKRIIK